MKNQDMIKYTNQSKVQSHYSISNIPTNFKSLSTARNNISYTSRTQQNFEEAQNMSDDLSFQKQKVKDSQEQSYSQLQIPLQGLSRNSSIINGSFSTPNFNPQNGNENELIQEKEIIRQDEHYLQKIYTRFPSFQVPQIQIQTQSFGILKSNDIILIRPEFFTIKITLHLKIENQTYFLLVTICSSLNYQLQLSIPTSYTVQDLIIHSVQHFNYKIQNYKLKQNGELYGLIKANDDGKPDNTQPSKQFQNQLTIVLHHTQNVFDTDIQNFILFLKENENKVLLKIIKSSSSSQAQSSASVSVSASASYQNPYQNNNSKVQTKTIQNFEIALPAENLEIQTNSKSTVKSIMKQYFWCCFRKQQADINQAKAGYQQLLQLRGNHLMNERGYKKNKKRIERRLSQGLLD